MVGLDLLDGDLLAADKLLVGRRVKLAKDVSFLHHRSLGNQAQDRGCPVDQRSHRGGTAVSFSSVQRISVL